MKRFLIMLIFLFLASCGISEKVYQRDMKKLQDQIVECEGKKEDIIKQKQKLIADLDSLTKEKGALSVDLKKAIMKKEELEALADKRKKAFENLKNQLQSMIAAGKLKVKMFKGQMVVEMAEKVLFDVGKDKLKREGQEALVELTPILAGLEGRMFQVAGHTDSQGSDEMNWRLSVNRALSVVEFMIEQGMPSERISAAGYSKFHPVATNETPEGRAQNRRIEIILVPNLEELQIGDID